MMKINIFGDLVLSGRADSELKNHGPDNLLTRFSEFLQSSDFNIVNLEAPIISKNDFTPIPKVGPHLRSPVETVDFLKYHGFNVVTLANNHIMDYGEYGLSETQRLLNQNQIQHLGAGDNVSAASQPLLLKDKKEGVIVGFLNFAEHEFSLATPRSPGANPLNPVSNHYLIRETKKRVDHLIVIIHGGHEHYSLPSPRMQETYRFFIDSGADLVVGHHTHCYSGYEYYNKGMIYYSLGNFIFDKVGKRNEDWNYGYGLSLNISKKSVSSELLPYNQFSDEPSVRLLKEEELETFDQNLRTLNSIIDNSIELKRHHELFCADREKSLNALFEPYENRILRALRARNMLPSFISHRKYLKLYNYLLCESHKETVDHFLTNKI